MAVLTGSADKQTYWNIQLDEDLFETIINIYPEWFKEAMTESDTNCGHYQSIESVGSPTDSEQSHMSSLGSPSGSPLKAEVDDASILNAMDRNKESLKVKLMLRRPINQLIEQGILPPLRTSANFYSQKQKLERAKTGDFLKHKIQRRPQRQELIDSHILEDTTVDRSLHEKQLQLKKARLADDLNDRISHRPGPLELIKGNILHTDSPFEQAVKDGQIHFKKTSEGEAIKHPPKRFVFEEESSSDSQSAQSPTNQLVTTPQSEQPITSSVISFDGSNCGSDHIVDHITDHISDHISNCVVTSSPSNLSYIVSSPVTSIFATPSTVHSILIGNNINTVAINAPNGVNGVTTAANVVNTVNAVNAVNAVTPATVAVAVAANNTPPQQHIIANTSPFGQTTSLTNTSTFKDHSTTSKSRKKAKSKSQPKTRTIKFHEYKGPPNAKSQTSLSQANSESSYELLLQQQQLFLQWQLEWQQKYPQIILPAAQKMGGADQSDQGTGGQCATTTTLNQNGSQQSHLALKTTFQTKSINNPNSNTQTNNSNDSNISVVSSVTATQSQPTATSNNNNNNNSNNNQSKISNVNAIVAKFISKLEDMKVSDLKAELKKRNLPVSGAKQQLIDRLKPYTESVMSNNTIGLTNSDSNESKISNKSETSNTSNISTNVNTNTNSNTSKSESSLNDIIPMSPNIVIDSPMMCETSDNKQKVDSPSNDNILMDVDVDVDVDSAVNSSIDNCIDIDNSVENMSATPVNDEIVLIQQQRIAELQRELQKSQMQLQKQQSSTIPIESQTVTIPISNRIQPQFHIVSTTTPETIIASVDSSQKTIQRQLLQQHLQHKLQQQNINIRTQQQINNETNLANLLTNSTVSPSVKASLAAFLQNQQQQQTLNTKLLNAPNVSTYPQLVFCPTLCDSNVIESAGEPETSKQRTNSLPNGLSQRLLNQRTSSLPNFSTLIGSATPSSANLSKDQSSDIKPKFQVSKPPPDYNEATKQITKTKDKKKSIKSQAVDDVLEILIKNGELPPSAAHDPTTPTTPPNDKQLSLKSNPMPNMFPNTNTAERTNIRVNDDTTTTTTTNNNNNSSNSKTANNQNSVNSNATLDFDFILDLEGLAEAIDLNIAINEKSPPNDKINNNNINNNNNDTINSNVINNNCSKITANNDMSFSEFMDFQDCGLSVEDTNWLEMATTSSVPSMSSSELNVHYSNEGENVGSQSMNNHQTGCNNQTTCSSNLSKIETSRHDPILPNTMFGGNLVDPLGDLFFDDNDFKTSIDLGTLMWDKVDFAT